MQFPLVSLPLLPLVWRVRKKYHPLCEKFYYELVKGWAKGLGFWKKPSPLFYLAPPRDDIKAGTCELRRSQVGPKLKGAQHCHPLTECVGFLHLQLHALLRLLHVSPSSRCFGGVTAAIEVFLCYVVSPSGPASLVNMIVLVSPPHEA